MYILRKTFVLELHVWIAAILFVNFLANIYMSSLWKFMALSWGTSSLIIWFWIETQSWACKTKKLITLYIDCYMQHSLLIQERRADNSIPCSTSWEPCFLFYSMTSFTETLDLNSLSKFCNQIVQFHQFPNPSDLTFFGTMALPPMICGMQQFVPLQSPTGPVHIPQAHQSFLETQWLYHFHHTKTEGMVPATQQSGTVPLPVPVGTQVRCLKLYPRFSWFQQMLLYFFQGNSWRRANCHAATAGNPLMHHWRSTVYSARNQLTACDIQVPCVNLTGSKHDLLTMHFAGVQGSSGFRFIDSVVINWQRQSRGLEACSLYVLIVWTKTIALWLKV